MKRTLVLVVIFCSTLLFTQLNSVIIGDGTLTAEYPLGCYFGYERTASLYTANEIGITGKIESLGWYPTIALGVEIPVRIYLKTTLINALSSDTWDNTKSGATIVYDGLVNVQEENAWYTLALAAPFIYLGGTDNLLVLVETNYGDFGYPPSTGAGFQYTIGPANTFEYWRTDFSPPIYLGNVYPNRPNIQIALTEAFPMTILSSTTTQNTSCVFSGDVSQQIIGIEISTTGTLAPLSISQFTVNANGTTDCADISNAKLFSTGNDPVFSTANQFGTTVVNPTTSNFVFAGNLNLESGINYFWLTCDISGNASKNHFIDAECNAIIISSEEIIPVLTAPTGVRIVKVPLSGNYTIGTNVVCDFPTITSAIEELNTGRLAGPVIFTLNDTDYSSNETFPLILNSVTGSSVINTVTFKPALGITGIIIKDTSYVAEQNLALLTLHNCDYVTWNGSNNGSLSKDLSFIYYSSYSPVIKLTGNSANNTIENCTVLGANSLELGYDEWKKGLIDIELTSDGNDNSILSCNLGASVAAPCIGIQVAGSFTGGQTIRGCNITGMTDRGIYINNAFSDGINIQQNIITNFGTYGICADSCSNLLIEECDLSSNNASILVPEISGIYVSSNNAIIRKCVIHNITSSALNQKIYGIYVFGNPIAPKFKMYNNVVNLGADFTGSNGIIGIKCLAYSEDEYEIFFNTVHINGCNITNGTSTGLLIVGAQPAILEIMDNALVCSRGFDPETATAYDNIAVSLNNNYLSEYADVFQMDFNELYAGIVCRINQFTPSLESYYYNIYTLAEWREISMQDTYSISASPMFVSTSNLRPAAGSPLCNAGIPIPGIHDDVVGDLRSANPTIGAYETSYQEPLDIPINLSIRLARDPNMGIRIVLNWDVVTGATSYNVYWADTPYPVNWLFLHSSPTNRYSDFDLSPQTRFYKIKALR